MKDFIQLVFKKATSEEIFCPLYAKLLAESSQKYPIILDEMNKLHENYTSIFNEEDDNESNDYQTFVSKNVEKKYRLGYSQFLSELTLLQILPPEKLKTIFVTSTIFPVFRLYFKDKHLHTVLSPLPSVIPYDGLQSANL